MNHKKDEHFIIALFDLDTWKELDTCLVCADPIQWQHYFCEEALRFKEWEDARDVANTLIMQHKELSACCIKTINPKIPFPQTTIVSSPFPTDKEMLKMQQSIIQ